MNSHEPLDSECRDGLVASKRCTKCLEVKPVTEFTWAPSRLGLSRHSRCRACRTAESRVRYLATKEQVKQRTRSRYAAIRADPDLWHAFSLRESARHLGLDPDLVAARFKDHDGLCDICGEPSAEPHPRLHIDHDHETGELRGLLCHNCNTAIGLLRDSSELVMQAAAYLERHGK